MNKIFLLMTAVSLLLPGSVAARKDLQVLDDYTMIQSISPNGRYVVGYNPQNSIYGVSMASFVYDTSTGELSWVTEWDIGDWSIGGQINGVNDSGVMCGTAKDMDHKISGDALNVAAVWEGGTCTALPHGDLDIGKYEFSVDGTRALAISSDGRTVAGNSYVGNSAYITPVMWTKDDGGEWSLTQLPVPEGSRDATVKGMSADGTIVLGGVTVDYATYGILWKDGQYQLLEGSNDDSELGRYATIKVFGISPSGRYITMLFNRTCRLYDVETGLYRVMPSFSGTAGSIASLAVDDNGNVTGAYSFGSAAFGGEVYMRPFWYCHKEDRIFDLDFYISLFAPGLDAGFSFRYADRTQAIPVAVSGDGNVIAGNRDTYISLNQTPSGWVLHSEQRDMMFPDAPVIEQAVSDNLREVRLTWGKDNNVYDGLTLVAYNVYRGSELVKTVEADADRLSVTLEGEPGGYLEYAVEAVFADGGGNRVYSPMSDPVRVGVVASYGLPLTDDFDSGSLETNFWTVSADYGAESNGKWSAAAYTGLFDKGLFTRVNDKSPYSSSITSRPMDATGETSVKLSLALVYTLINGIDMPLDKDTVAIEVTTDRGATWQEVEAWTLADMQTKWSVREIDLSELVAGEVFQLRLHKHGQGAATWSVTFDILSVTTIGTVSAPKGLAASRTDDGQVVLIWETSAGCYSLNHISGLATYKRTIGNDGNDVIAANMFTPDELTAYKGKYLSAVSAYINYYEWYPAVKGLHVSAVVFEDGEVVREQQLTDIAYNAYNTVTFDEALPIDGTKELKIGLKLYDYDADQLPLSYAVIDDYTPGKSDLYSEDGGQTWLRISDFYADQPGMEEYGHCAWDIAGIITDTPFYAGDNTVRPLCYNVFRDGRQISRASVDGSSTRFVDSAPTDDACYEVVAYYTDGSTSAPSEQCCLGETVGISSAVVGDATVTYDPAQGIISIGGSHDRVVLYDISGRPVAVTRGGMMPTCGLTAGIYVIGIESGGSVRTLKIVVR